MSSAFFALRVSRRASALGCHLSRRSTRATRTLVSIATLLGIVIVEAFGVLEGISPPRYNSRQLIQMGCRDRPRLELGPLAISWSSPLFLSISPPEEEHEIQELRHLIGRELLQGLLNLSLDFLFQNIHLIHRFFGFSVGIKSLDLSACYQRNMGHLAVICPAIPVSLSLTMLPDREHLSSASARQL